MPQIPNTFTLYGQTWTIRTTDTREMQDNLGLCYADSNEILLNHNQSEQSLVHTLMHELLHSIELKQHLEMTERQIDCMALGLIHLFKSNPNLITLVKEQSCPHNEE